MDWFFSASRGLGHAGSGLSDDPPATFWSKWFGGVVCPALLTVYAGWGLVRGELWFPIPHGRYSSRSHFGQWLDGVECWCAAGVMVGLALVLHTFYFWGQRYASDHAVVYLGKALGLLLTLISGGVWLFRWVATG